jgi:hypothetical protein
MEDNVANILFADKTPPHFSATRTIKELAKSIIDINGSFAVSKMPSLLSIVNVYSEGGDATPQVSRRFRYQESPPESLQYLAFDINNRIPTDQVRLIVADLR